MAKKEKEKMKKDDVDRLREAVGLESEYDFHSDNISQASDPLKDFGELEKPIKKVKKVGYPMAGQSKVDTELFVKIDEHTEVAAELVNIKKDIKLLIETISLLAKAEKLKEDAISKMEKNLEKLNKKLQNVERKLMVPEGLSLPEEGEIMKDKLTDLHSELESLKSELSTLK